MRDAISMTTTSNFSGIQKGINVVLVNQQRAIETYNDQQQADGMATQSDIVSIPQTNNVNDNIPSTTLTNQQHHSFVQNSQAEEQQTMITEPEPDIQANPESINVAFIFDDNINFPSLVNQQGETFEQHDSQRTQQQPRPNIGIIPENINVVLGNQQRVDEDYNQQQQADSPITISDIVSISQANNTNDDIPSATNQRLPMFEQNSQVAEQHTMSMITEPSIHGIEEIMSVASDNIHTEALVNQQQEIFEQDDSQDSQQQGLSMTTQPDSSQESTGIAGENNNSSEPLINTIWSLKEKVNKWIQKSSETGWQFRHRVKRANSLVMQESVDVAIRNLHEIISDTTDTIRQLTPLMKPDVPQGQVAGPYLENNSVSTLGASGSSSTSAVSSNQINEVTITPLTVTQTGDLLGPTERRRLVINSSFFMKTEQHLVWKGSIECRKKRNGSQVTQPLNCRIYGLKTESGNINV